jgi:hypothetical protein
MPEPTRRRAGGWRLFRNQAIGSQLGLASRNKTFGTDFVQRHYFASVNLAELAINYDELAENFAAYSLAFGERHFFDPVSVVGSRQSLAMCLV